MPRVLEIIKINKSLSSKNPFCINWKIETIPKPKENAKSIKEPVSISAIKKIIEIIKVS
jgi:hypothetical protein